MEVKRFDVSTAYEEMNAKDAGYMDYMKEEHAYKLGAAIYNEALIAGRKVVLRVTEETRTDGPFLGGYVFTSRAIISTGELEELQAENARLREALGDFMEWQNARGAELYDDERLRQLVCTASNALKGGE